MSLANVEQMASDLRMNISMNNTEFEKWCNGKQFFVEKSVNDFDQTMEELNAQIKACTKKLSSLDEINVGLLSENAHRVLSCF